jgi:ligand-binding sensor domain-containing protein/signal transduction histidine kinase/DNA-binding response OmpR family regulator
MHWKKNQEFFFTIGPFMFCIYLLFFCFLFFSNASARQIRFNKIDIEHGLIGNAVQSIGQDSRGFMWIGTYDGLVRYDGNEFRNYTRYLPDRYVGNILTDSKQRLWIGTGKGLSQYFPLKDRLESVQAFPGKGIYSMCEDKKGRLWIGSAIKLGFLNSNRTRYTAFPSIYTGGASDTTKCILQDNKQRIWIGTSKGMFCLQEKEAKWTVTHFKNPLHSPGSNLITSIAQDALGRLWVGTQNDGLYIFNPENGKYQSIRIINNNIRKVAVLNNAIWVGTQEGLSIINPYTLLVKSYQHVIGDKSSLSQNSIHAVFKDHASNIWVGTYFGGINITYSAETPFSTIASIPNRNSLSNNVVSSMTEDKKGNLWIGTEGGGLNYYDRRSGHFTIFKHDEQNLSGPGSNLIKKIYLDDKDNIWVGSHGGGLTLIKNKGEKFVRYLYDRKDIPSLSLEILSILNDGEGKLWLGTDDGLKVFWFDGIKLTPYKAIQNPWRSSKIYAIVKDKHKRIWLGNPQGLWLIANDKIKLVVPKVSVNCLYLNNGTLWAGLYNKGLLKYEIETQKSTTYCANNGLLNNNVLGILEDGNKQLWLSTDYGLVKFNPVNKLFKTYTIDDGLAGNRFNYNAFFKDSRGFLFFGGYDGITWFHPDSIKTNNHQYPLYLTQLKLFDQPVTRYGENKLLQNDISFTKAISLAHDQNTLTLNFGLLNFIKSSKNLYQYKLENFDREWINTNQNHATYSNLPPGGYKFVVRGKNNDGIPGNEVSLSITIHPPFWRTWWAYGLYLATVAGIIFFIVRFFYLRALLKKEDELHQVKLNFFTNVSHEIRTHLSLINIPLEKISDDIHNTAQISYHLNTLKANTNRLNSLVTELMDFRMAETKHLKLHIGIYNLVETLEEVYKSFQHQALAKQIQYSFLCNKEDIVMYFDQIQLQKVFFNLLSNAFKFTPQGGCIQLTVECEQDTVMIKVTDNGRGIASAHFESLFTNFFQVADYDIQNTGYGIGLALSKHILELHSGTIKVQSMAQTAAGNGSTVFTIMLPRNNPNLMGAPSTHNQVISPSLASMVMQNEEALSPYTLQPFSILVIEDNDELRQYIVKVIEPYYKKVYACRNGEEGWEFAISEIPDLIISDVMMPGKTGYELCMALKSDERTSHIPVILLTAKTAQTDMIQGLEKGADIYLTKPFSTKILSLHITNLLASRERLRLKYHTEFIRPVAEIDGNPATQDLCTTDREFLNKLIEIVQCNMHKEEFGVDTVARETAMSLPILYKKIKAITNMSVNDFIKSIRLKKAAELLKERKYAVYQVMNEVGYNDRKHFAKEFRKYFGVNPSKFGIPQAEDTS